MTRRVKSQGCPPSRGVPTECAAIYVGCQTIEQFEREVAAGIWPQPFRKDARPKRWDLEALDAALDRMSGIKRQRGPVQALPLHEDATGLRTQSNTFEERARNFSNGQDHD